MSPILLGRWDGSEGVTGPVYPGLSTRDAFAAFLGYCYPQCL
jgi:hypothetical protein